MDLEDVEDHKTRLAFRMGMCTDDLLGTHGGKWDEKLQRSGDAMACAIGAWGCWACKLARDREERARRAAAAPEPRPLSERARARARAQWADDEGWVRTHRPTAEHVTTSCTSFSTSNFARQSVIPLRNMYQVLAQHEVEHPAVGPARLMAERALEGARARVAGDEPEDGAWKAHAAVLAGALPRPEGEEAMGTRTMRAVTVA